MDHTDALIFLGMDDATDTGTVEQAAQAKLAELRQRLESAPTPALKAKYEQMIAQVEQARAVLQAPPPQAAPPAGLSQTMMADLPGAAPSYTQGAGGSPGAPGVGLQAGQVLMDRYEIREQIGVGGMGAVYRAHDRMRSEDIAIKVMLPALLSNEKARERFFSEAKISSKLSHPNIVNVFDVQSDGAFTFLTMELLEGQTLRDVMKGSEAARQRFDVDEVVGYLKPLCDALEYAHEFTVHRDLKPENVFLTEDGKVKLMDFGIARVMGGSQLTETVSVMGTAYYMAPEALKGAKGLDGRVDQYALGVMAYELLAGEIPAGMAESLREVRKDVPRKLSDAVSRALASKPERRFESIGEFAAALGGAGARRTGARTSAPGSARASGASRGKIGIAACVMAIMLGALVVKVTGFGPGAPSDSESEVATSAAEAPRAVSPLLGEYDAESVLVSRVLVNDGLTAEQIVETVHGWDPRIESVMVSTTDPYRGPSSGRFVQFNGVDHAAFRSRLQGDFDRLMGVQLVMGRFFFPGEGDMTGNDEPFPPRDGVVLINQAAWNAFGAPDDIVGQELVLDPQEPYSVTRVIVGVVEDLPEVEPRPMVYETANQQITSSSGVRGRTIFATMLIESDSPGQAVIDALSQLSFKVMSLADYSAEYQGSREQPDLTPIPVGRD